MREFKEIKEEIFTRSYRRIKRRKRILTAAVTLSVCCVIGISAFALMEYPYISSDNSMGVEESEFFADDKEYITVFEGISKIRYGGKEYTSDRDIIEITDALQNIINNDLDEGQGSLKSHSITDEAGNDLLGDMSERLFVVTESGHTVEYIIGSDCITDVSTGVIYKMTERHRQALLVSLE